MLLQQDSEACMQGSGLTCCVCRWGAAPLSRPCTSAAMVGAISPATCSSTRDTRVTPAHDSIMMTSSGIQTSTGIARRCIGGSGGLKVTATSQLATCNVSLQLCCQAVISGRPTAMAMLGDMRCWPGMGQAPSMLRYTLKIGPVPRLTLDK
jgi:hypothetical protein